MKIVESADGTVRVLELDPSKIHWIIADADSGICWERVRMVDGLILLKRPEASVEIVEGDQLPEGVERFER